MAGFDCSSLHTADQLYIIPFSSPGFFPRYPQLRGYLSEPLLEQIPPLIDLQRYLHQLTLMELPTTTRELILEQVHHLKFISIVSQTVFVWNYVR